MVGAKAGHQFIYVCREGRVSRGLGALGGPGASGGSSGGGGVCRQGSGRGTRLPVSLGLGAHPKGELAPGDPSGEEGKDDDHGVLAEVALGEVEGDAQLFGGRQHQDDKGVFQTHQHHFYQQHPHKPTMAAQPLALLAGGGAAQGGKAVEGHEKAEDLSAGVVAKLAQGPVGHEEQAGALGQEEKGSGNGQSPERKPLNG